MAAGRVRRILKEQEPSGYEDLVSPLSSFQKQRNSRENQGRTSPQATAAAATPTSLSLARTHPHTDTHTLNMHKHTSVER